MGISKNAQNRFDFSCFVLIKNEGGLAMDLYKELTALRCFTHSDMVRLTGSESAAI